MNRIYQGRVTSVEISYKDEDGKEKWSTFDLDPKIARVKWQHALWQHHELFQDAVNYYSLALAAMAAGVKGDDERTRALRGWAEKVKETWQSANRKSATFAGPQKRLAAILNIPDDSCTFEKAAARVLQSSRASGDQRAAALQQLLSEKGDLNQICVSRLPWLATASGKFTATSKTDASSQEEKRQIAVRQFHKMTQEKALENAESIDLGLFLTQPPTEHVEGEGAAKMLRDYFSKASKKFPELISLAERFKKFVADRTGELKIPSPGRKPSGLYPVAAVFKFFHVREL